MKRTAALIIAALILVPGMISGTAASATPSQATPINGVVTTKTNQGELLPGVTVEIRSGSCSGSAVWRTTTGTSPAAYSRFAYTLPAGIYCFATLSVPGPYRPSGGIVIDIGPGYNNIALWQPGTYSAFVAVLDVDGKAIPGVEVAVKRGTCAGSGAVMPIGTTSSDPFRLGQAKFDDFRDAYCATATSWPAGYAAPSPANFNTWLVDGVILWIPRTT